MGKALDWGPGFGLATLLFDLGLVTFPLIFSLLHFPSHLQFASSAKQFLESVPSNILGSFYLEPEGSSQNSNINYPGDLG